MNKTVKEINKTVRISTPLYQSFHKVVEAFYRLGMGEPAVHLSMKVSDDTYILYEEHGSAYLSKCEWIETEKNSDMDNLIYKLIGTPREVYRGGWGVLVPQNMFGKMSPSLVSRRYVHKENCKLFSNKKKCSCQTVKWGWK